jgi:hypothetical protein
MLKFLKRLIILVIAAGLGTVVYIKWKAVENIMPENISAHSAGSRQTTNDHFSGGIGPVGNPNTKKSFKTPLGKNY